MLNWTTVDLMSFKTSKCKQMIISRKKSQHVAFALSLGGQVLEIVNHYKYLGFCLLADLSWSAYSVYLHQSQKNHGHPLPTASFQAMWIALPLHITCETSSRVRYYIEVWNLYLQKDIAALENVQKFALKVCFK